MPKIDLSRRIDPWRAPSAKIVGTIGANQKIGPHFGSFSKEKGLFIGKIGSLFGTGPYDREAGRNLALPRVNSTLEIDFGHKISI